MMVIVLLLIQFHLCHILTLQFSACISFPHYNHSALIHKRSVTDICQIQLCALRANNLELTPSIHSFYKATLLLLFMRRLYCLFDWNIQRDCFVKRGLTGMGIKLIVFIFTGLERHLINNFHSIPSLAYPVPKQLSSSCNHKSLLKEKETPERTSAQQNLVGLYFMLLRKSDGLGNF